ncbi:hypothetical protein HGM15179_016696 [Zosterops borbonicus]|uniref:Uncharacterized protein n=1 Tax=Zosterops borbonicus TaxID=364589 RepID=A0A8K1LE36_9PASS|nr:hypothetical protein HGM15179_016696 [Zosterops borbonicus]
MASAAAAGVQDGRTGQEQQRATPISRAMPERWQTLHKDWEVCRPGLQQAVDTWQGCQGDQHRMEISSVTPAMGAAKWQHCGGNSGHGKLPLSQKYKKPWKSVLATRRHDLEIILKKEVIVLKKAD